MVNQLFVTKTSIIDCPFCGSVVTRIEDEFLISTTDNRLIRVICVLKYCSKCDRHYCTSNDYNRIRGQLREQVYAGVSGIPYTYIGEHSVYDKKRNMPMESFVTLDGNADNNRKHYETNKCRSTYCSATLCSGTELHTYTIVTDSSEANYGANILYYSNGDALEILTAIILGRKTVSLRIGEFTLQDYRLNERRDQKRIITPEDMIEVVPKKNGGYFDPDDDTTLFDALVPCTDSQRLQRLVVSYSKSQEIYYVDSRKFRNFCKEYGFPITQYATRDWDRYTSLREESELRARGYSVNETDGLSTNERRRLLERIVDSDSMKVYQIVNHLEFLISFNGGRCQNAVDKWQEDLEYISTYRVNPDRFVIVKEVRGRIKFIK